MASPVNHLPRYWSLDILRGLCALAVFLTHWTLYSNFAPAGAMETGLHGLLRLSYEAFTTLAWPTGGQHPAVIGFFVLSGFCIHGPFERRLGQPGTNVAWRDYFVRRTRRIMPVYWTGTLLGLMVMAAVVWRPVDDALLALHTSATPGQVAARILGYSALWPEEVYVGNVILGSVAVEIVIYLGYPLFWLMAAAGRWRLLAGLAVGLHLVTLGLWRYIDPIVLYGSVLVMAFFWYLGALLAHLRVRHGWRVRGWWLASAWLLFLAAKQVPHFYGLNMLRQAFCGVIFMLLIGWLLDWEKRHEAQRDGIWTRVLLWSGAISYPLFAVHTPVILLVNWAMLASGNSSYGWQLALNLVLPVGAALLVHRTIEQHFYRPQFPAVPPPAKNL